MHHSLSHNNVKGDSKPQVGFFWLPTIFPPLPIPKQPHGLPPPMSPSMLHSQGNSFCRMYASSSNRGLPPGIVFSVLIVQFPALGTAWKTLLLFFWCLSSARLFHQSSLSNPLPHVKLFLFDPWMKSDRSKKNYVISMISDGNNIVFLASVTSHSRIAYSEGD